MKYILYIYNLLSLCESFFVVLLFVAVSHVCFCTSSSALSLLEAKDDGLGFRRFQKSFFAVYII